MLLPIGLMGVVALFASDYSNGGTRVVGHLPPAEHYAKLAEVIAGYVTGVAPFAMAAAWRTFVHTKRWLETGALGRRGILEAGACGFAGAVIVLLPGIVTRPLQAPPYVIAYGGLSAIIGLAVGLVLWATATLTLKLFGDTPTFVGARSDREP